MTFNYYVLLKAITTQGQAIMYLILIQYDGDNARLRNHYSAIKNQERHQ